MSRGLCLLVILLAARPALAQDEFAREGVAISAGAAFALEDFDDEGIDFDNSGAAGASVSYRFHPNFGVEGHFEHTFDFSADFPTGFGNADVDVTVWSLTANAQFFLLTGRFQPYVNVGIGYGSGEITVDFFGSDSDTTSNAIGRAGLGMDTYLTEHVVVAVEGIYNFGFGDLDSFNYWTLGGKLRYRF